MSKAQALQIWMNGELVGTLSRVNGKHELVYEADWVASPRGRPLSLSLPFLPGNAPHRGDGVLCFFENLLPDRPDVRTRLRDRFRAHSAQAFDLLAEIGRDCVGAIQLLHPNDAPPMVKAISGEALSASAIARRLEVASGIQLPGFNPDDFRISLAGAQEKTAFLKHQGAWHQPIGPTPSTHIFKLPMGTVGGMDSIGSHSVENEWLCSKIMAAYGLPVAQTSIAQFEDYRVLIVERFDRQLSSDGAWWIRLPVEDFCQIKGLSPEKKYEADGGPGIDAVMSILSGGTQPEADRLTFFKTQIVFWLLAAADGHAKNFSVFLGPQGSYHLAPLYDILSVYPWLGRKDRQLSVHKLKMAMAVRGRNAHYTWDSIHRRHWLELARRHGLGRSSHMLIAELIESLPHVTDVVGAEIPSGFPEQIAELIFDGMRRAAARLTSK